MPFVQRIKRTCIAIGGGVIWAVAGIFYSLFAKNQPLPMLCQFMASMGASNVVTLSIGLAQELSPVAMRARVLSAFMMVIFGLQPAAAYLVGWGADGLGINSMMRINGVLMIGLTTLLLTIPALHRLKAKVEIPAMRHPITA